MNKTPSMKALHILARTKSLVIVEGLFNYIITHLTDNPTTVIAKVNMGTLGHKTNRQAKRIVKGILNAL